MMKYVLALLLSVGLLLASCDSQAGDEDAPPRAAVWLTTPDGQSRLAQRASVPFEPGPGDGRTAFQIEVDAGTRYQEIDGFGAAMTNASAYVIGRSPQRDDILARLFSREAGIGIGYVRVPMGASDFTAVPAYTYDDVPAGQTDPDLTQFSIAPDEPYILPALKAAKALNPDLLLMGSPWSAPAWMKTSGSLNGGRLRPEYHAAYADYFVRFVEAYRAEGLPIDAVTVQNEPQHETNGYPSMRMEASEQAAFVRDALGPAFAAAGLDTKILVWDHNWDQPSYPLAVLQDAGARAFVDGVAWHCYAGGVAAQNQVREAFPGVDTYFTECSGGEWDSNFGSVVRWNMQNLFIRSVRGGARTVLLWNLALDANNGPHRGGCDNCRGLVTVPASGGATYEPEYYAVGHLSKFVLPGAHRIGSSTFQGELESVAFQNPDGSVVVVVLNAGNTPKDFDVAWDGQHLPYRGLPSGAVVTFHWPGGA